MFDLETARKQAREYTEVQGRKWLVMETAADAPCNQSPSNTYNTGRYIPVPESDAMEYAAGGCRIADLMLGNA